MGTIGLELDRHLFTKDGIWVGAKDGWGAHFALCPLVFDVEEAKKQSVFGVNVDSLYYRCYSLHPFYWVRGNDLAS